MKVLLCSVAVLLAVAYVHCDEEHKKFFQECKTEAGITEEKHGPPNFDDPKEKCFHACLMKKTEKMVDGKISLEKVVEMHKKFMPDESDDAQDKIKECVENANQLTDECEVAGALVKCLFDKFGPPPHPKH